MSGRQSFSMILPWNVLDTIQSHNPTEAPLLDSVQHLTANLRDLDAFSPFPQLVMWPALKSINIDFTGDIDGDLTLPHYLLKNMITLLSSSPDLTSFTMTAMWRSNIHFHIAEAEFGVQPDLLRLFRSWQYLEEFQAQTAQFNYKTLGHFAALYKLKKLSFSIGSSELSRFIQGTPEGIFKHLIELDIKTDDLKTAGQFLLCPGFNALESLRISGRPGLEDPYCLFDTIQARRVRLPLKSLTLWHTRVYEANGNPSPRCKLEPKIFTPLFPFTGMTVIDIDLNASVTLDNSSLCMISRAFPRLRILKLLGKLLTGSSDPPKVTLDGLLYLASLADLEQLEIQVDAMGIAPVITEWQVMTFGLGWKLKSLGVSRSPVNVLNVMPAVQFLHAVFPNLETLDYGYGALDPELEPDDLSPVEGEYMRCWMGIHKVFSERQHQRRCIQHIIKNYTATVRSLRPVVH